MIGPGPARARALALLSRQRDGETPAFAPLRDERGNIFGAVFRGEQTAQPPDFLERYLRIASYLKTLDAMIRYPQIDDPATRPFIGNEPEQYMLEEFPGLTTPSRPPTRSACARRSQRSRRACAHRMGVPPAAPRRATHGRRDQRCRDRGLRRRPRATSRAREAIVLPRVITIPSPAAAPARRNSTPSPPIPAHRAGRASGRTTVRRARSRTSRLPAPGTRRRGARVPCS